MKVTLHPPLKLVSRGLSNAFRDINRSNAQGVYFEFADPEAWPEELIIALPYTRDSLDLFTIDREFLIRSQIESSQNPFVKFRRNGRIQITITFNAVTHNSLGSSAALIIDPQIRAELG